MAHKIKPAREFILPRRFRVGYRPLMGCLFDHVMRRHRGTDAAEGGMPLRPVQLLPTSFLPGGGNLEDVVRGHTRANPGQGRMPLDPAMVVRPRLCLHRRASSYAKQSDTGYTGGKDRVAFRQFHDISEPLQTDFAVNAILARQSGKRRHCMGSSQKTF